MKKHESKKSEKQSKNVVPKADLEQRLDNLTERLKQLVIKSKSYSTQVKLKVATE